jgi:hypothetical protein
MYQHQTPYQSPVYLAPPNLQQSDPIDSAAKILDLFQKLQQSTGGGNFAPGQSQQASASVGQMSPVGQQQIAHQEQLLRNPESARQQQVQIQQEPGSLNLNAQQSQALQRSIGQIVQGAQSLHQGYQKSLALAQNLMVAFNAMCEYATALEQMVSIGQTAMLHANTFRQEADAAHNMIDVLKLMLTDPEYLVSHAFTVWDETLQGNVQGLDHYISPAYMRLVADTEEKHKQKTGQYSPKYSEYLQQQINQPHQPQPIHPQQQPHQQSAGLDYIKQFAEMLQPTGYNTSELGANIRRQHVQRLRG